MELETLLTLKVYVLMHRETIYALVSKIEPRFWTSLKLMVKKEISSVSDEVTLQLNDGLCNINVPDVWLWCYDKWFRCQKSRGRIPAGTYMNFLSQ